MRKYFSAFRSPYVARNHRNSSRQNPAQAGFCLSGVGKTPAGARGIPRYPTMTSSRVASPRSRGALPLGFISLREDPRSRPWRDTSGGFPTVLLTALSLIEALSYHKGMRYVVTLFLGALL